MPYSRRKVPPYIFTSVRSCPADVGLPTSSNDYILLYFLNMINKHFLLSFFTEMVAKKLLFLNVSLYI